jgi:hypothetical protein
MLSSRDARILCARASDYLRALDLLDDHPPEGAAFVRLARARSVCWPVPPATGRPASSADRGAGYGFDWAGAVPPSPSSPRGLHPLTAHATAWAAPRDTEADALSELLGLVGTSRSAPAPTPPAPESGRADQSSRQFIGREAAAVAGALRDAAHGLTSVDLPSLDRLSRVSSAMHSLRGLAGRRVGALGDLLEPPTRGARAAPSPLCPRAAELCLSARRSARSRATSRRAGAPDPSF